MLITLKPLRALNFQQICTYNVLQMPVARFIAVDWCASTSKWSIVKWDQPCFKGACRHGPQNISTVRKAAQAFAKTTSWFPIEGLAITSMTTISRFFVRTINPCTLTLPQRTYSHIAAWFIDVKNPGHLCKTIRL